MVNWGDLTLQHQGLTVADEHVQGAVRIRGRADADQLRQIGYQLIALIEQLIGRLAAVLRSTGRRSVDSESRSPCAMELICVHIRGDA